MKAAPHANKNYLNLLLQGVDDIHSSKSNLFLQLSVVVRSQLVQLVAVFLRRGCHAALLGLTTLHAIFNKLVTIQSEKNKKNK